jgi:hypothetical protein
MAHDGPVRRWLTAAGNVLADPRPRGACRGWVSQTTRMIYDFRYDAGARELAARRLDDGCC